MTGALTTREEEGEGGAIRREAAPRRLAPSVEDGGLPGWAYLQASLPVVDNNRKVVGALSVVGEEWTPQMKSSAEDCGDCVRRTA